MKSAKFSIVILLSLLMAACAGGKTESDRLTVTVSIPPQAWFVEAIAGDSADVNVLLPSGANPESFEPGMSAIKEASRSEIIFVSGGLGFETSVAEKLGGGRMADVSEGIDLLYGTHDHHCDGDGHHHHGEADPHTWTSVKNGRIIATNIYNGLKAADPAREAYYTARYGALMARIDSLDEAIAARLADCRGDAILVMHPSLGYFARDYGMRQVSIGSEGKDMSVQGLKRQLDEARSAAGGVLFVQAEFDSRQAETVAGQVDARVEVINLLNPDWEGELTHIADVLSGEK
ncbi:MAG: zinc ABC transporter substrate-binding protein [Muribaculaceae bacterium]|nr:zinc ABC transporter substrate-binding protein [Muribaculaceae bacterium]